MLGALNADRNALRIIDSMKAVSSGKGVSASLEQYLQADKSVGLSYLCVAIVDEAFLLGYR